MKFLYSTLFLMFAAFLAVASGDEPLLVKAAVRELALTPNSPPLENRNVPGKPPPTWNVRLEILQVFRGDPKLKGQLMITATADLTPEGNRRFVVPRLNEGDVGIWAIKQLADGRWAEVYSAHEVEKGILLPLIKGRHDAYEKVLLRLSGGESSQPSSKVKAQKETSEPAPSVNSSLPMESPTLRKAPETKPTTSMPIDEHTSSTPWSIIVFLTVAATGLLWLVLKNRCKRQI